MKKVICASLAALVILFGSALPGEAWRARQAWRGHGHSSVFVGPVIVHPWWGPVWGPRVWVGPPYYSYSPPFVVEPAPPPVYIEEAPQRVWYFCENPQGYYPDVQQCPGGWREVVPPPTPGQ